VAKKEKVLLFMVDGAIKRYVHYEENKYPGQNMDGMELLDVVGKPDSRVIVMVINGYGNSKSAVAAIK
jgi:hypothetical protein